MIFGVCFEGQWTVPTCRMFNLPHMRANFVLDVHIYLFGELCKGFLVSSSAAWELSKD
jgi:hypothetical protein